MLAVSQGHKVFESGSALVLDFWFLTLAEVAYFHWHGPKSFACEITGNDGIPSSNDHMKSTWPVPICSDA